MILARDIENNKRLLAKTKPFKPVKIPIDKATTKMIKPPLPNISLTTCAVPHKCFSDAIDSHGAAIDVASIIKLYKTAAKKIAKIINVKAFLARKSNSDAHKVTTSNTTN